MLTEKVSTKPVRFVWSRWFCVSCVLSTSQFHEIRNEKPFHADGCSFIFAQLTVFILNCLENVKSNLIKDCATEYWVRNGFNEANYRAWLSNWAANIKNNSKNEYDKFVFRSRIFKRTEWWKICKQFTNNTTL